MPRKAKTDATSMEDVKVEPDTTENLNTGRAARAKRPERPMALMTNSPTPLDLPSGVVEWFKVNELVPRWVRYKLPDGSEDTQNITKMKQMGYEFVQLNEFDTDTRDQVNNWFIVKGVRQSQRDSNNQCITTGDVVLAKIPQEWYDEYRARELQGTLAQERSDREAIKNSQRDLNKYVPVNDDSMFGG